MAQLQDIKTVEDFDAATRNNDAVVHFWAPWCAPCKHMDAVLLALAQSCPPSARFLRVEAEEDAVADLSERYDVSAVPHFLVFKGGKVAAAVEGADATALASAVTAHVEGARALVDVAAGAASSAAGAAGRSAGQLDPTPPPKRQPPPHGTPASAVEGAIAQPGSGSTAVAGKEGSALTRRIEALLASAPVLLFMKGSPDAPRCGFSAQVVAALRSARADFRHFDILQDDQIRQGLKDYSDWPTYPQLYVEGDLVGGADIVLEMAAAGELAEVLPLKPAAAEAGDSSRQNGTAAAPAGAESAAQNGDGGGGGAGGPALQRRLQQLTTAAPVVLFMKGSREAPFCKFSKAAVAALNRTGVDFDTFDVFQDDEVREGLKDFSGWPTYPQLYAHGELVGGADIIAELAEGGELRSALEG